MKKKNKKVSKGVLLGVGAIALVLVVIGVVSANSKSNDGYLSQANSWLMAAVGASSKTGIIYGTPDQYEATEVKDLKNIPAEPAIESANTGNAGVVKIHITRTPPTRQEAEKASTFSQVHTIHQPTDVDIVEIFPPGNEGKTLLIEASNPEIPLNLVLYQIRKDGSVRNSGTAKKVGGTYEYLTVNKLEPDGKYYLRITPAKKVADYQKAEYTLYTTYGNGGSKTNPKYIKENYCQFYSFVDPTEEHWFQFDAKAGQNYSIFTKELDPKIDTVVELYELYNSKVRFVKSDDNSYLEPRASVVEWNAEADKKMLVMVKNKTKKFDGSVGITGKVYAYRFCVSNDGLPADGPGIDMLELLKNKEGLISESGTIDGNNLNNRVDVDYHPLVAKNTGDTFAIELISKSDGFNPSMILYKLVKSKEGKLEIRFEKSGESSIDFVNNDDPETVYFIAVYDKNKKARYADSGNRRYRLEITYAGAQKE